MTPHPVDVAVDTLTSALTRLDQIEVLGQEEQEVRDYLQTGVRTLRLYRRRQFAAEAFERNGDSRYVRELFSDAGVVIPSARKVVPFPDRTEKQTA